MSELFGPGLIKEHSSVSNPPALLDNRHTVVPALLVPINCVPDISMRGLVAAVRSVNPVTVPAVIDPRLALITERSVTEIFEAVTAPALIFAEVTALAASSPVAIARAAISAPSDGVGCNLSGSDRVGEYLCCCDRVRFEFRCGDGGV